MIKFKRRVISNRFSEADLYIRGGYAYCLRMHKLTYIMVHKNRWYVSKYAQMQIRSLSYLLEIGGGKALEEAGVGGVQDLLH